MRVALFGQKGGSGKSTLAVSLACELAQRKWPVLLLDADRPQYSAAVWAQGGGVPHLDVRAATDPRLDFANLPDDVVFDCPGRLDDFTRAALVTADIGLVPVSPSGVEQWTIAANLELAELANKARQAEGLAPLLVRLVRTRWRGGPLAAGVEQQHDRGLWLKTTIGDRQAYRVALSQGRPLRARASWSTAADEIKSLAKELRSLHA